MYRWEALRRISKASPLNLAAVVRSKDQDLEEAVRIIFPDDVPAGAKTSAPAGLLFRLFKACQCRHICYLVASEM